MDIEEEKRRAASYLKVIRNRESGMEFEAAYADAGIRPLGYEALNVPAERWSWKMMFSHLPEDWLKEQMGDEDFDTMAPRKRRAE